MEFIDYKCLESLLIEGEEIANEGISELYYKSTCKGIYNLIYKIKMSKIFKSKKSAYEESTGKNFDKVFEEYDKIRQEKVKKNTIEFIKFVDGLPNNYDQTNKEYTDINNLDYNTKCGKEWNNKFNEAAIKDVIQKYKCRIKYPISDIVKYFEENQLVSFSTNY